jgi:bifunctional NMN adenylyltransferase/nudix hydrolase
MEGAEGTNMKAYDSAVLIGRFQPFHAGHLALFRRACQLSDRVIVVIGSHEASLGLRNPWSSGERREIIDLSIGEAIRESGSAVEYVYARDSAYNFSEWLVRVQRLVRDAAGEGKTAIVGHFKDDSSSYLKLFPDWVLEAMPSQSGGVSSTALREAYYEGRLGGSALAAALSPGALAFLERWNGSAGFSELAAEHEFVKNYRRRWEGSPYPPTFVTADAVVFALGRVLVVRRGRNPGKGRLAFPGGFVNVDEGIEAACLRELREETGIDVAQPVLRSSIKAREVFDHPLRDPRGRLITHAYMFELGLKELPAVQGGDDASQAFWLPLHRLEDEEANFFSDHAQILRFFMNRLR